METWTRDDGRFATYEIGKDLYGHAVICYYGGAYRPGRVRIIPVADVIDGEKVLAQIAHRRELHGYKRCS